MTEAQIILKELINKFNLTEEEIAIKFNVRAITVYRWRDGKNNPSFITLKYLKRMLKNYHNKLKEKLKK